jgi:hypothetical protein
MSNIEIVRPLGTGIFRPPGGSQVDETILVNSHGVPFISEFVEEEPLEDWDPQGTPIINDDFSSYNSRSELLDTDNNDWDAMWQGDAVTPGEFIYLEESPPTGSTGGKAMQYLFEGTGPECDDRRQDTGGGARKSTPTTVREQWSSWRTYLSQNWTFLHPCGGHNEYKFLFHTYPNGRADITLRHDGIGTIFPGAGFNSPSTGLGSNLEGLIGRWIQWHWYTALPTVPDSSSGANDGSGDGIMRLWIDETLVLDITNINSHIGGFDGVRLGANLNWTLSNDQSIFWDRYTLWGA